MPNLVYILACSHSGSTLLAMLLGAHPDAVTVGELTGARTSTPEKYRCSCGLLITECRFWAGVTGEMKARGMEYRPYQADTDITASADPFIQRVLSPLCRGPFLERLRDLTLAAYPPWHHHLRRIQERNAALIQSILAVTGAKMVVDSAKRGLRLKYLLHNPALDVKVIRLIRDGRGVALTWTDEATFADATDASSRGGGFGRDPIRFNREQRDHQITRGAHVWRRSNQEAEQIIRDLPNSRVLEIRYEQLCADPRVTMQLVNHFLGLDPAKQRFDFRSVNQHVLGNGMRLDKAEDIRLDERWRTHLSAEDLAVFDQVAGRFRRAYGYA